MSLLRKLLVDNTPKDYIKFADPAVEKICAENWGDGTGITYAQAAKVKTLGDKFRGNTEITSFDELQYFYNLNSINDKAFQNCTSLQSVIIPETTTAIGNNTFECCSALTGDLQLENVLALGESAFRLTGYSTIKFPNVTSLKSAVFARMANLTNAFIPKITNLPNYCFMECANLLDITFDCDNCNAIGQQSFQNCANLKLIINFSNVTTIGVDAFYHCDSVYGIVNLPKLTSVPKRMCPYSSITDITDLGNATNTGYYAFSYCNNLTKVIFSDKIKTIDEGTLSNCLGLKYVEFKCVDIASIGRHFLDGCTGVKSIIIRSTTVPSVNYNEFLKNVPTTCNIYLPDDSITSYIESDVYNRSWKRWQNNIKPLSEYVPEE